MRRRVYVLLGLILLTGVVRAGEKRTEEQAKAAAELKTAFDFDLTRKEFLKKFPELEGKHGEKSDVELGYYYYVAPVQMENRADKVGVGFFEGDLVTISHFASDKRLGGVGGWKKLRDDLQSRFGRPDDFGVDRYDADRYGLELYNFWSFSAVDREVTIRVYKDKAKEFGLADTGDATALTVTNSARGAMLKTKLDARQKAKP